MAIVPSGVPAWLRENDHTVYGGHTEKKNYQSRGAVNGRTDVTAANLCRIAADLAAVGRVAPFCTFTCTLDDAGTSAPTISNYHAMSGSTPTGARVSDGVVALDWATSYADDYSVVGAFNIVAVLATLSGSMSGNVTYQIQDTNADDLFERVKLYAWTAAGAAFANAVLSVTIWTGPSE